jgi:hypothetical protein
LALRTRFQFQKRDQFFVRTHNEALTVAAMRVSNPDCLALQFTADTQPSTPTGFAELASDDFQYFISCRAWFLSVE